MCVQGMCCCVACVAVCAEKASLRCVRLRLQCGCPSSKVCHKRDAAKCFGARLMLDPEHTGECLRCVHAAATHDEGCVALPLSARALTRSHTAAWPRPSTCPSA
jgi:hypothetical protein